MRAPSAPRAGHALHRRKRFAGRSDRFNNDRVGPKANQAETIFPYQLQIEVTIIKAISVGGVVKAVATVDGQRVAYAELSFSAKNKEEVQRSESAASVPVG